MLYPNDEETRETAAGDVLREPRREHYDNAEDFAEMLKVWQEAIRS